MDVVWTPGLSGSELSGLVATGRCKEGGGTASLVSSKMNDADRRAEREIPDSTPSRSDLAQSAQHTSFVKVIDGRCESNRRKGTR